MAILGHYNRFSPSLAPHLSSDIDTEHNELTMFNSKDINNNNNSSSSIDAHRSSESAHPGPPPEHCFLQDAIAPPLDPSRFTSTSKVSVVVSAVMAAAAATMRNVHV